MDPNNQAARLEFTFKAFIFSMLLAVLLAASNAYLALKIGTTISASIPAAVLAIGLFRFFKRSSVFECNLVQTAASSGEGVAAAVAFILPALIILHLWTHFHYLVTALIVGLGGLMGVLFSVPLRQVLLNLPELRFPEGTAIGNVLRATSEGKGLLKYLLHGVLTGGVITFLQDGLQLIADSVEMWGSSRNILFGTAIGFSPAAFAAGFIIGPAVCLSILLGIVLGWGLLMPVLSHYYPVIGMTDHPDAVNLIWSEHLRFVGVGTMLIGGIWTLLQLLRPMIAGFGVAFSSLHDKKILVNSEKNISMVWLLCGIVAVSIGLFLLVAGLVLHLQLNFSMAFILEASLISLIFLIVVGFLLATVCGYLTGIVGSTNNPLSGILILSILILASIYLLLFHLDSGSLNKIVGLVIMVAAVVAAIASISNENMQDLKAGMMIGATPWKQQVMLALGVIASSLVIGPIFQLLFQAYGMGGVFPHAGMDPTQSLSAPQASLMAAVAEGVLTHNLNWIMVTLGVGIGVLIIVIDLISRSLRGVRFPVLAVGLGIYLPPDVLTPIVIGGFLQFFLARYLKKRHEDEKVGYKKLEQATLLSCGMVAGSSLMGVFLAIPFIIMGSANALAVVGPSFGNIASCLGFVSLFFLGYCVWRSTR